MIGSKRLHVDIDIPLREKIKNSVVDHRGDFGFPLHKSQHCKKRCDRG